MEAVYIEVPIRGRVKAGYLSEEDGQKVLLKEVIRAKHYFNLVKGYALQRPLFLELKRKGFAGIKIHETDTGDTYYATMEDWSLNGSTWTGQYGSQQTLSEKYMKKGRS